MGVSKPRPLAEDDNRLDFDCGRASLNEWFQRHAWKNHKADISRTNVICDSETGQIVGYVTLLTAEIRREFLVKPQQRNKPETVPVILLGQLAVDVRYQGQGLSKSLLFFAFKTVLHMADVVGCYGVVTHPLDDSVRAFYQRYGFQDIPYDPRRAMMVRITDLRASGF